MTRWKVDKLKERLAMARECPDLAHMPAFGLVLYGNQKGPTCSLCGGVNAPIVNGQHLNPERWCNHA